MDKFPITSKNGNEYLVKIEDGIYSGYDVRLYKKVKIKIFFKDSYKNVFLREEGYADNFMIKHGFIGMVTHIVEVYEESVEYRNSLNKAHKDGIKEFKEWDGIIK